MNTKAQTAVEVSILITFMILSLTIFLAVISNKLAETADKKEKGILLDMTSVLENEVKLAATSEEGYQRVVTLPPTLEGKPYSAQLLTAAAISGDHSEIVAKYQDSPGEVVALLPMGVTGNLCIGSNLVEKKGNSVMVTCIEKFFGCATCPLDLAPPGDTCVNVPLPAPPGSTYWRIDLAKQCANC